MEANEVSEFANQMKESGESGGESLKSISLGISILAVLVAMVTVLGHRTHTEAVLMQSRAGDQWNEYQAKKIRMDNLSVTLDLLAMEPTLNAAATEAKRKEYEAHIEKWKEDLTEEQEKAREFEAEVTRAEAKASHFDLGEALLQIAVVLCSVTLFTRRRAYFLLGLSLGAAGVVVAGLALLVR
jgi:flagellar biosynthesis protein FliP